MSTPLPILTMPFRGFFLFGTLFSALAIGWWAYYWSAPFIWQPYGGPLWWHGHEMVFGFAAAIVVGFLLTAVQTWTGTGGIRGLPLALLLAVWFTGRILIFSGHDLSPVWVAGVDVSFLPLAAFVLAYPIVRIRQWRNILFVPILLTLSLLNGLCHWALASQHMEVAFRLLHLTVMLVVLLIIVVGGRVIPTFTANGTGTKKVVPLLWLDYCCFASYGATLLVTASAYRGTGVMAVFLLTAVFNGWRFLRWRFWRCWRVPLLWSLHLAYGFIPLGLLAMAANQAGLIANTSATLHVFSTGAIGGVILAMISRVSLGHTGRPLSAPPLMVAAFALILLSALVRVVVPEWFPARALQGIVISATAWSVAYGIFCWSYTRILFEPRADGEPG